MTTGNIKINLETEDKVEVDWKITNFFSLSLTSFKSPLFKWSCVDWQLLMKNNNTEIQLYLYKFASEKRLPVLFKFGIRLRDGTTEMRSNLVKNFPEPLDHWGNMELILRSELEERKHQILPHGILMISCSIATAHPNILKESWDVKYESNLNETYENLDNLSSDFKTLYGCLDSSDITIIVGEERYPVHKAVLAARSSVFAAMFKHDMEELKTGIINIHDSEPTSFKDFLRFLYTGKVENFSSNNVFHLYGIADKYNVQQLKVLCIKYMKKNLSPLNLFHVVTLANKFDESELMSVAQDFFNNNSVEIITGDDWEQFMKHNFPIANELLVKMIKK